MSGILDSILGQLTGSKMDDIATKIGANRQQTESAVKAALPSMVEGLGRNSGNSGSQTSLDDLYRKLGVDKQSGSISGAGQQSPGNMRVPTEQAEHSSGGLSDILGGFFGGKKENVGNSIGKQSGLNTSQVGAIVAMLGPMVLGALTSKAKASGKSDVHEVVQKEREEIHKEGGVSSMLGSMFDQDGDGDFDMSDAMAMGKSALFGKK